MRTNAPRPGETTTRPRSTRLWSASRTSGRLTPRRSASSRSDGSFAPSASSPETTSASSFAATSLRVSTAHLRSPLVVSPAWPVGANSAAIAERASRGPLLAPEEEQDDENRDAVDHAASPVGHVLGEQYAHERDQGDRACGGAEVVAPPAEDADP